MIAHPGQILEPNSLLKLRLLGGQLRVEFELGEGGMQRDAEALRRGTFGSSFSFWNLLRGIL